MEEIRILLGENKFTNICKSGFLYYTNNNNHATLYFTKDNILNLTKDEIVSIKSEGLNFKLKLSLDYELAREIIKRSPLFSELYYELPEKQGN